MGPGLSRHKEHPDRLLVFRALSVMTPLTLTPLSRALTSVMDPESLGESPAFTSATLAEPFAVTFVMSSSLFKKKRAVELFKTQNRSLFNSNYVSPLHFFFSSWRLLFH